MERGERLPELDLLRAVALVAVALIHASAWVAPAEAPPNASLAAAISSLARFCVPAFVFASGFALQRSSAGRAMDRGAFLGKRVRRILLPWAACVPLFLWVDSRAGPVGTLWQWLAFGPGHLYFLLLTAQLSVVFVFMPRDARRLRWFALAAVAVQLGLSAWRTYAALPASGWLAWAAVYLTHEEAPFWIGTFALGALLGSAWDRLAGLARWWPLWVALAFAAGAVVLLEGRLVPAGALREGNGAYAWPSRLPQAVMWSLALLWAGRLSRHAASSPVVQALSRHSLGIYLLHPLALTVLGPATVTLPAAMRVPLLMAAALSAGWALTAALGRLGLAGLPLRVSGFSIPNVAGGARRSALRSG